MVRRSILTFGVQVLQLGASLALAIVVTRVTGAHGKGVYTLILLVVTLATLAASLGIAWASIYHISRKTFPLEQASGTLVTASLGSAAVATAAIGVGYLLFRDSYFRDVSGTQIIIALAAVPLVQLTSALGSILVGLNRVVQFTIVNLVQVAVALAIQGSLAAIGRLSVTAAIAAWALGVGVGFCLLVWMVVRLAPIRPRFSGPVFRSFLSFGSKGYIANLMALLNYRLDALIVNGLIGVTSLGIYSIAVAMGELLWYLANSTSLVMFPHIAGLAREEADRVTPAVTRNTLLLTLIGALAMLVMSRWLILLVFGPAMLPALIPLWLLLPGIVALSAGKVIASYLSGIGRPIYATYISGISLVLTLILDLLLIPRFGIAGAAVASSIVYISVTVAGMVVFVHESKRGWFETLVVQREDFPRYRRLITSAYGRLTTLGVAHS